MKTAETRKEEQITSTKLVSFSLLSYFL